MKALYKCHVILNVISWCPSWSQLLLGLCPAFTRRSGRLREGKAFQEGCRFCNGHLLNLWVPQKQAWDGGVGPRGEADRSYNLVWMATRRRQGLWSLLVLGTFRKFCRSGPVELVAIGPAWHFVALYRSYFLLH